jgi:hypothetical protein
VGILRHGGPLLVELLGGCPTPTTRQASGGDRHLNFYEDRDNLIQGREPDGDSIHFHPSDPNAFAVLHLGAQLSSQGGTQLRLEAIDALKTHYSPRVHGGFLQHQPLELAHAAAATLLQLLGFSDVQRDGERVTARACRDAADGDLNRTAACAGAAVRSSVPVRGSG